MSQGDLSLESFRRILELHPDLEHLELQGEGEPLLNANFISMLELARERDLRVSVITNGSLLSPDIVEALLRLEVSSIHCSLESAEPNLFREIRGGKFEKLKTGLTLLVRERNARGLAFPQIGLAVTVLKKTMSAMAGIVEFYQALGLDAGIFIQPLQKMPSYTSIYDEEMKRQLLSHEDLMAYHETIYDIEGWQAVVKNKKNVSSFYRNLGKSVRGGETGCPWLLHGTFISYTGNVMPCCTVKSSDFSLGNVGDTPLEALDGARTAMNQQLVGGAIPTACERCGLARKIAGRAS